MTEHDNQVVLVEPTHMTNLDTSHKLHLSTNTGILMYYQLLMNGLGVHGLSTS